MAGNSYSTDFLSYVLSCVHYSIIIITIQYYYSLRPAAGNTGLQQLLIDA